MGRGALMFTSEGWLRGQSAWPDPIECHGVTKKRLPSVR